MDLTLILTKLGTAIQTTKGIIRLLDGGELLPIFRSIGDVHFTAASKALEDMRISSQPQKEMESAIASLRVAHTSYKKVGPRGPKDWRKLIGVISVIAVYYLYREEKTLAKQYLDEANEEMESWCKITDEAIYLYHRGANRLIWAMFGPPKFIKSHLDDHETWKGFKEKMKIAIKEIRQ